MNNTNETAIEAVAKNNTEKVSNSAAKMLLIKTGDGFKIWDAFYTVRDGKAYPRGVGGEAYTARTMGVDAWEVVRKRETVVRETYEVL